MKILPPETLPPATPTARRHRPESARWSAFRPCLRWDFGFTCAFCLLHEADLYGGAGGEGLGGTTTEHRIARSHDAARANDYDNCIYACRFCNRSRSASPLRHGDSELLDPTRDAWNRHFAATAGQLQPAAGDASADLTHDVYELDDPRKVERRRVRQELVSDRLRLLEELDGEFVTLLELADHLRRRNLATFSMVLQRLAKMRADQRRALTDLRRYAAIPHDAPRTCRCRPPRIGILPFELDRQTIEVRLPPLDQPAAPV